MDEKFTAKFVLYNLKYGILKDIVTDGDSNAFPIAMSFVESLVSPPSPKVALKKGSRCKQYLTTIMQRSHSYILMCLLSTLLYISYIILYLTRPD